MVIDGPQTASRRPPERWCRGCRPGRRGQHPYRRPLCARGYHDLGDYWYCYRGDCNRVLPLGYKCRRHPRLHCTVACLRCPFEARGFAVVSDEPADPESPASSEAEATPEAQAAPESPAGPTGPVRPATAAGSRSPRGPPLEMSFLTVLTGVVQPGTPANTDSSPGTPDGPATPVEESTLYAVCCAECYGVIMISRLLEG